MTLLDDIEAKARVATPGLWYEDHTHISSDEDIVCDHIEKESDRKHIAQMDPPTTLALVSALRVAREALEKVSANTYGTELCNTDEENNEILAGHFFIHQNYAREALTHLDEIFKEEKP